MARWMEAVAECPLDSEAGILEGESDRFERILLVLENLAGLEESC